MTRRLTYFFIMLCLVVNSAYGQIGALCIDGGSSETTVDCAATNTPTNCGGNCGNGQSGQITNVVVTVHINQGPWYCVGDSTVRAEVEKELRKNLENQQNLNVPCQQPSGGGACNCTNLQAVNQVTRMSTPRIRSVSGKCIREFTATFDLQINGNVGTCQ